MGVRIFSGRPFQYDFGQRLAPLEIGIELKNDSLLVTGRVDHNFTGIKAAQVHYAQFTAKQDRNRNQPAIHNTLYNIKTLPFKCSYTKAFYRCAYCSQIVRSPAAKNWRKNMKCTRTALTAESRSQAVDQSINQNPSGGYIENAPERLMIAITIYNNECIAEQQSGSNVYNGGLRFASNFPQITNL